MDERESLPSASGMARLQVCPGSFRLEQTQPPEPESEEAASGTKIHAALARAITNPTKKTEGLSAQEMETFVMCLSLTDELQSKWLTSQPFKYVVEKREWLIDQDYNALMSGQYDLLFMQSKRGLVIDYKTGHGDQVESARNVQLRALAVLVAEAEGLIEITTVIVQPWATMNPEVCTYGKHDLLLARTEIQGILDAANDPNAPLVPTEDGCKYCRAKLVCPALKRQIVMLASRSPAIPESEFPDLPRLLDACGAAQKFIDAVERRARAMLEADADSVPGYCLEKGKERRTVTDATAAFAALSDKIDAPSFTACCTVKISELETAFRTATGQKVKDAKPEFERRLTEAGCLEKKACSPSLAKAKPALPQQ